LIAIYIIGWSVELAATLIAITLTLSRGMVYPIIACRVLGVRFNEYLKQVFIQPLIFAFIFALPILLFRMRLPDSPDLAMLWSSIFGVILLSPLYWFFIMPITFKNRLISKLTGS
jgi:hypothetical protein